MNVELRVQGQGGGSYLEETDRQLSAGFSFRKGVKLQDIRNEGHFSIPRAGKPGSSSYFISPS